MKAFLAAIGILLLAIHLLLTAALALEGNYDCTGTNPDGSRYRGTTTITHVSTDRYSLKWSIGTQTFTGTGALAGNTLTVDWGDKWPVIYKVSVDGTLEGTWSNGRATETLVPRMRARNQIEQQAQAQERPSQVQQQAQDEGPRLFAAHALALRAAGVAGEKEAGEVLAAMPGAEMVSKISPAVLWSSFFANTVVKLGRLRSSTPTALYYNPLLDAAVITFWVEHEGGYRVSTARALPGERLSDPKAKAPPLPSWLSAWNGVVAALTTTTKARLKAFWEAHPAVAQESVPDIPTLASARADMKAVLPRLLWNAVQRAGWTDEAPAWLGPTLTAVERALGSSDYAVISSAAPDTDLVTADALADLPSGFADALALDMVVEALANERLLIGSSPEDGAIYVLALCWLEGNVCKLRRFVLAYVH